jgi:hypothetical protein
MSPYGRYFGIQVLGGVLWMTGGVALMSADLGAYIWPWMAGCVAIMLTSWLVRSRPAVPALRA